MQLVKEFCISRGIEAYLVGGVVRDALLGRATAGDIDVAVGADALATGRDLAALLGGHLVVLDQTRAIVRVVVPRDGGAIWFVDLQPMRGGILDDLAQRDFTVNAMAVPVAELTDKFTWENVIDPLSGRSDLDRRLVRSVDRSVFDADPVRLVRAPRLAAQLRFQVEEATAGQIQRHAHLVQTVAPERVRDEFLKLLAEPGAAASMRHLDDLGLLSMVIPELDAARGITQPKEHYWDVFNHLVEAAGYVDKVVHASPESGGFAMETVPCFESMNDHFAEAVSDGHTRLTFLKLAGLLHDIGKPATRTVEPSGRIRFLGHDSQGAEIAGSILKRLRIGGRGVHLIKLMVQHHLRPSQMSPERELPSGKAIYRYFRDAGDAAIDTLYLNLADYLAARESMLSREDWVGHCRIIDHILREGLERKAPEVLPHLVDGHAIMDTFSLEPGPQIGLLLDLVRETQASGEITTKDEALELVKANLKSGGGGA